MAPKSTTASFVPPPSPFPGRKKHMIVCLEAISFRDVLSRRMARFVHWPLTQTRTTQPYCSRSVQSAPTAKRTKRALHSLAATPEEAPRWLPQLLVDQTLERHRACPRRYVGLSPD
jgi:hypothetical protein